MRRPALLRRHPSLQRRGRSKAARFARFQALYRRVADGAFDAGGRRGSVRKVKT